VAVKRAIPVDLCNRAIGALLRVMHAVAERTHAQHAAAAGQHPLAVQPGAGLKHLDLGRKRAVQAMNHVAAAWGVGIVRRRHHHTQRRARIPLRVHAIERAVERRFDQLQQIRLQAQQDRLRFRVAKTHVELDHPRRAVGVDHQTSVKKPGERHAVGSHAAHGRLDHLAHHPRMHIRRHHRCRRIRAHAAGVGAGIAVADALVILAAGHRQCVHAIDQRDEAGFLAVEKLLDHHPRTGIAVGVAGQHVVQRRFGIGQRQRHHHALARRQTVGLDHDRRAVRAHMRQRRRQFVEHRVAAGGDAVPLQELLGECLAAFELRGGGAWSEHAQTGGAKPIDYTGDQRRLRADHGEIHRFALRQRQQRVEVGGRHRDIAAFGFAGGAGIARRHQHFAHARGLRELPGQRVFAATIADHQQFHRSIHCGGINAGNDGDR